MVPPTPDVDSAPIHIDIRLFCQVPNALVAHSTRPGSLKEVRYPQANKAPVRELSGPAMEICSLVRYMPVRMASESLQHLSVLIFDLLGG